MTLLHKGLQNIPDGQIALSRAQSQMRGMTISEIRGIAPEMLDSGDFDGSPVSRPFENPLLWAGFCYTGA